MKFGKPAIMVCPFCGHNTFIRKTEEEIQMIDDGENITDELVGNGWSSYTYRCVKCKKNVTDAEMKREGEIEKENLEKVC